MIFSMTGYGRGEAVWGERRVAVEIRSVNNRFFDLQTRLPRTMAPLESKIKEMIQRQVSRGRFSYLLTWEGMSEGAPPLKLDMAAAESCYRILANLRDTFRLDGDINLDHLLSFSEVLKPDVEDADLEACWPAVEKATQGAIDELKAMRAIEGEKLADDMIERLEVIRRLIREIEALAPKRLKRQHQLLGERLAKLIKEIPVDQEVLATELAVFADRCDVTEECVRLNSHLSQFSSTVDQGGTVGKRLTFLLQEMGREASTIGAKANDAEISHRVVSMKEELERIREQLQNVE